jgi:uncharacterized integral membrane protein
MMRRVYLVVIILFAAASLIFALQNLESVNVSFLGFNVSTRLAILVFIIYALGAVTGGSLFGLLRRSYEGSALHVTSSPHPRAE